MEFQRLMGVKVATSTPYHPQSDGQAERTNHTVERMLRSYAADNQEDWDLWIAPAEYAINDSRSAATGFSPFELVRFAEQLQAARASLRLAQQRMIEQFDSRHRSLSLNVGDRVWIDGRHLTIPGDRGLKPKLRKLRHGPLPIVECLYNDRQMELPQQDRGAPAAYRLELPAKWNMHDVFTADRLTPVVSGAGQFAGRQAEAPPPPVMAEGQREVEVERIFRTRTRKLGGKGGHVVQEWLTKWNSVMAEAHAHLDECTDKRALAAVHRNHALSRQSYAKEA
ncbi:hypothetical protein CYMTET_40619 [Cymbomonas tetramitiformis]|uniref:Integrase catalytic domain-containing protein n=1 Tax=Cymbomonas tetramitiformis TaxID=36881 RepID=A0AAE0C7T2_9CHLO|nr:hypothetical protein CYMTET_40619 [Cymbomonas tetramitiformis]